MDGYGKTVAKRDNQIVIKENGKEEDYFCYWWDITDIDNRQGVNHFWCIGIAGWAWSWLRIHQLEGSCGLHAVCTL